MSNNIVVTITSDLSMESLKANINAGSASKLAALNSVSDLISSMVGGVKNGSIAVKYGTTAASGTVTCASVSAADTVTIQGVVLTAVSGTPAADQFDISGSNTADGDSLVRAIGRNSTLAALVSASNAAGVVTITALDAGTAGNSITLASSNGTRLAVSGATLASGADTTSTYSCGL